MSGGYLLGKYRVAYCALVLVFEPVCMHHWPKQNKQLGLGKQRSEVWGDHGGRCVGVGLAIALTLGPEFVCCVFSLALFPFKSTIQFCDSIYSMVTS